MTAEVGLDSAKHTFLPPGAALYAPQSPNWPSKVACSVGFFGCARAALDSATPARRARLARVKNVRFIGTYRLSTAVSDRPDNSRGWKPNRDETRHCEGDERSLLVRAGG